jgi:hypothetical protein
MAILAALPLLIGLNGWMMSGDARSIPRGGVPRAR